MIFCDQKVFPRWRDAGRSQRRAIRRAGFTLLEVILAIFIVIGMLTVVLYFYQQAARLRSELLLRTDEVSAVRLLMDRMTTELRTAFAGDDPTGGLTGTSNSITFLREALPDLSSWSGDDETNVVQPSWDLARISYSLLCSEDLTNVVGVQRLEEPLLAAAPDVTTASKTSAEDETLDVMAVEDVAGQNEPEAEEVSTKETEAPPSGRSMVAEQVRFLRFRYWDGTEWLESWDGMGLPVGVEISLGGPPLPAETVLEEYPDELYRRVVYLPGSAVSAGASAPAGLEETLGSEPGTKAGASKEVLAP